MKKKLQFALIASFAFLLCHESGTAAAFRSNPDEFAQRRSRLMSQLDDGIMIFTSAKEATRNNDVNYEYRQDSDFYYLTGFEEPNSAFLLIPGAKQEFIMFVQQRDPLREVWTGKRHGVIGAMETFGADTAFTIDQFEEMLPRYLYSMEKIYYAMDDEEIANRILAILKQSWWNPPKSLSSPLPFVHEMRLIKSPAEIDLLRRAIDITGKAHVEAMKAAEPGMFEYEIEAIIEYIFKKNGAERQGFPSIVGSGPNATILHYETNDRQTMNGDVVVMDIGAEFEFYSADVTRTIPMNGRFSKEQREIYELVLEAQQTGIDMIAPGVGIREVQNKIADVVKDGLFRLNLITDKDSNWQYRVWYWHGPCHWLGLDVHDSGSYSGPDRQKGRILEAGIVTTVEPGLYFAENTLDQLPGLHHRLGRNITEEDIRQFIQKVGPVARKYTNIGVRIEDDVLVTEGGHELLSGMAPRSVEDIEELMGETSYVNN